MSKKRVNKEQVDYIQLGKSVFAIRSRNFDTEFELFRMVRGSWLLIGGAETYDHIHWMIVRELKSKATPDVRELV